MLLLLLYGLGIISFLTLEELLLIEEMFEEDFNSYKLGEFKLIAGYGYCYI